MKVLVTGATGFVASHLIPRLAAGGHEVVAAGHDTTRIPQLAGVQQRVVDLAQPLTADALPAVDAIVHLAQANVRFPDAAPQLFAVNAGSTLGLLDHARRTGSTRFVFTSSASVYGFGDRAYSEDDDPAATDFYALTKRTAEELVASYRAFFGTSVLRLVAPYGPGQRGRLIPSLIDRVRAGEPVTLNDGGRPRMNPVFVDDLVEAIVRLLDADGHHLLNVAGDRAASIRELAEMIGTVVGRDPVFATGDGTSGDLVAENARMRATLGLDRLVALEDGLARTAEAG